MSLKLDELRKRLLQQQANGETAAPEAPNHSGNGKVFGTFVPQNDESVPALKVSEPPAANKEPEVPRFVEAQKPPVESRESTRELSLVITGSAPVKADVAAPVEQTSIAGGLGPESAKSRLSGSAVGAASASAAAPAPLVQHELADAVGKVFEQTKAFQARLEDLSRIFEPIDRMGNSAVRAFAPLRGFQKQMEQLARSFEPMRTFQQQLSELAQSFEPMKALESQLSQLAVSFQTHIGDLIKALEPAKQIRVRIEQLGAAFDQATELHQQFTELYDAFQLSPSSNGSHANGLDERSSAAS